MHIKNHTQLAPNETSEQPCQVNTYLSVAVSSYTKLENASVGAGTVLIQKEEEFAEQPHYGMQRNVQQYQAAVN